MQGTPFKRRAHLRRHTEDVRVILNETAHAGETRESTRCLVPMEDTKLCHPDGQLLVAAVTRVEDETVPRAVHWLQTPFFLFDIKGEHAVLVVLPVSGSLPQL